MDVAEEQSKAAAQVLAPPPDPNAIPTPGPSPTPGPNATPSTASEESADSRPPRTRAGSRSMMQERLQKILAHAGVTSRRKAEQLIAEGRVELNGQTVKELGTRPIPART